MRIKQTILAILSCLCLNGLAGENVNFLAKPLTAGKASLTEHGYQVCRTLGSANFSPELRYPLQLIYNSTREESGIFGFAWYAPQLESTAYYDKDGILWVTPWGEKIKFLARTQSEDNKSSFYSPFADWKVANTTPKDAIKQSGDWTFEGKYDYDGWQFVYTDGRLQSIRSAAGNELIFSYSDNKLQEISQNGKAFVTFSYSGNQVVEMTLNGVEYHFTYADTRLTILPKIPDGNIIHANRNMLSTIQTGSLNPVDFSYDDYGFLAKITQGDMIDLLTVEHQTEAERQEQLLAQNGTQKYSGPINGRIIADALYDYRYPSSEPGKVTLIDGQKRTADYDFVKKNGIFKISDFSGKSYTAYYFMRYDVAYMGKIRRVVDGRGREILNYSYDETTGNILQTRDIAKNTINYTYLPDGKLHLISRKAATQSKAEPVMELKYDSQGNVKESSQLDADGNSYVTTEILYDAKRRPIKIDNGQNQTLFTYNDFGYIYTTKNDFLQAVTREYDEFNRLTVLSDIYGIKTYYSYTPEGMISRIERKDGDNLLTSIAITYNDNGMPVSYIDQAGRKKSFERDAFGRIVKELFPDDTAIEYTYNSTGQLTEVVDQNKNKICFDWGKFGLESRTTPAGQLTDYVYDKFGVLAKIDSSKDGQSDRTISYEYDKFDRPVKITYGDNEVVTYSYDSWGKVISSSRGSKKATYTYDYFGRMIEKKDGAVVTAYTYNPWGQCTSRVTKRGGLTLTETKSYDQYGRLTEINSNGQVVKYRYNDDNQLAEQIIAGVPVRFSYTSYGQLESKTLGDGKTPISSVKYIYSPDGMIAGRVVDGKYQMYSYDKRGQLLTVADNHGNVAEAYVYDPAGNILRKTVNGQTTTYTYDKANQLVSSTVNGQTTNYAYDAAGRLVQEGDKIYSYGYLDKLLTVQEEGQTTAEFDYYVDGQIANARYGDKSEDFIWDGLALIHRGENSYINEPYITGGNPVLSTQDGVMFNDILGNTLGIKSENGFTPVQMSAFGETSHNNAMFTGKPYIGELGYAFLFRNYRPEQGKWQTSDPLGYPDGWNNFAYCGNYPGLAIDMNGAVWSWATGAIGAGLSVAGYTLSCCITGAEITTAGVVGAAAGGFVAGAVAGALIGDPSAATISSLWAAGAVSGAAGKLTNNIVSTALDPNQEYNYITISDGVLRNAVEGALTSSLRLDDLVSAILGFEVGILDELYDYAKDVTMDALNSLDQLAKDRLMQLEALME